MNKADLLQLLASSNRSIGDVRDHAPAVFAILQGLARDEARSQVLAGFTDAPAELKARVTTPSLNNLAIADMSAAVRKAMTGLSEELAEDGKARLEALEQGGAFIDPLLDSDVLLDDLALIQDELEQAKVYVVGDIAGVVEERFAKVVARVPSLMAIDDDMLAAIVAAGELREPKAAELGLTANLFQLFDEDAALTTAVKAAPVGRGPERKVTAVRDLADLDVKAWRDLLQRSRIVPPSGTDIDDYARSLARRVATLYPAEAFVRRLPAVDEQAIAENVRKLLPLLAKGPAIGRRFEDPAPSSKTVHQWSESFHAGLVDFPGGEPRIS